MDYMAVVIRARRLADTAYEALKKSKFVDTPENRAKMKRISRELLGAREMIHRMEFELVSAEVPEKRTILKASMLSEIIINDVGPMVARFVSSAQSQK